MGDWMLARCHFSCILSLSFFLSLSLSQGFGLFCVYVAQSHNAPLGREGGGRGFGTHVVDCGFFGCGFELGIGGIRLERGAKALGRDGYFEHDDVYDCHDCGCGSRCGCGFGEKGLGPREVTKGLGLRTWQRIGPRASTG